MSASQREGARSAQTPATRTAAVLVPDWPLLAALEREQRRREAVHEDMPQGPVILCADHRVVGCDSAAAAAGVAVGMKQRSARAACPAALLLEQDDDQAMSLFELVAAAVDTVAAGVDVLRPGVLLMAARGPARHQGGEEQLAVRIVDAVADLTGWDASVGIADGPFAALLAARSGRIVRPGESARYLAPYRIEELRHAPVGPGWGHRDQPGTSGATGTGGRRWRLEEVIDLLERLGVRTLEQFAALPSTRVSDRFGPDVAQLHLLSCGQEITPPQAHHPQQPIEAVSVLETPLQRADQAAFIARPLAERLQEELGSRGLVCTRLRITARTEHGEEMERTWRHEGTLSVSDVVDRIRWQCDGWITSARLQQARADAGQQTAADADGQTAAGAGGAIAALGAITQIGLHPLQVMPAADAAPMLWGGTGKSTQRAARAFARAQALAGEDAVLVPAHSGGRLLREQLALVPWRSEKPAARPGPWPGALPRPLPATVFRTPPPVDLRDGAGHPVVVTARGLLSGIPVHLHVPEDAPPSLAQRGLRAGSIHPVLSHSAPTVLDERWWEHSGHRGARLQMILGEAQSASTPSASLRPGEGHAAGEAGERARREGPRLLAGDPLQGSTAVLVLSEQGRWTLEGIYD